MTGQDLLDTMEILNDELQLQPGEADVARGLLALNVAQDHFEAAAARRPNIVGSSDGTFTQTASQEYSLWPTGLLRLDGLQYISPDTGRPAWDLTPRYKAGSHAFSNGWLRSMVTSSTQGKPSAYWTNGAKIFWDVLPDTTNTIRWYGLTSAANITAGGTFAYPDIVRLPIASFAASILKAGVDDDASGTSSLAQNLFEGTLDQLSNFNRSGAAPLNYSYDHR